MKPRLVAAAAGSDDDRAAGRARRVRRRGGREGGRVQGPDRGPHGLRRRQLLRLDQDRQQVVLPLEPGMQFTYEGRSNRGGGRLPHRVVFTVTDLTKEIDGVRSVVLWDRDINDGKQLEGELAFWAQDDDGNVWLMGEYPEEYDDEGNFEAAPDTWFSGIDRARAGIMMRGRPAARDAAGTAQGYAPTIGFADVAFVAEDGPAGLRADGLLRRRAGHRRDQPRGARRRPPAEVLRARDRQHPGRARQGRQGAGDPGADEVHPPVAGCARVRRKEALELEKRAYVKRKDVYGKTPPSQRRTSGGAGGRSAATAPSNAGTPSASGSTPPELRSFVSAMPTRPSRD